MSNRLCKKCGNRIPTRITLNGKIHNLQNRKFCVECSPMGKHNTKPDDPARESKAGYADWDQEHKNRFNQACKVRQYKKGLSTKEELVKLAGGHCVKCGYNKCLDAFVFHHKDPKQKLFGLNISNIWSHTRKEIMEEFDKCLLFCLNCHAELHREENDKNPYSIRNNLYFPSTQRVSTECTHGRQQ